VEILILSDPELAPTTHDGGDGCVYVSNRDEAADRLRERSPHAVGLDRRRVTDTLSDARWLRRRRNSLSVIAIVSPDQLTHTSDLLAAGVEEIVVRDQHDRGDLLERVELIQKRRARPARKEAPGALTSRSPAMRACLDLVSKAERSEATVLVLGETGTGKEVIARQLHTGSKRTEGPFVPINCAAFPETLLESELFGHERGAFTGAERARPGLFEAAAGGTLFLDEIGETSPSFQVKLLRALQEGVVRPLGSTREVKIDARIVAATNRDLEHEIETGHFRRDLFYRLNVFPIRVPPLRGRPEDIATLAREFFSRANAAHPEAPVRLTADAIRLLEAYAWPGNVRELENEVQRITAASSDEPVVTARMLSPTIRALSPGLPQEAGTEQLRATMARFEAWVLRGALERHAGRRIATARSLGITRECLYKKLKRYGMQ